MAFIEGDRAKLVKALKLHKDQAKEDSILDQLMDAAELFDTTNSTTYVADIQQAIAMLDVLKTQINQEAQKNGITRIEEFQIYQLDLNPSAGSARLIADRDGLIAEIKRLLDPENYLDQFNTTSRVIRTL